VVLGTLRFFSNKKLCSRDMEVGTIENGLESRARNRFAVDLAEMESVDVDRSDLNEPKIWRLSVRLGDQPPLKPAGLAAAVT
jgi:hypothetical protein